MEYKVAPSLLAADFTRLGEQVHEIEEAGAPYLHLDVMFQRPEQSGSIWM